jgi:peptide-methionine (S)-S-oxide reductase
VRQGWIGARAPDEPLSEAILLEYDPEVIGLETLIAIHLHSHSSTKWHSMRDKYRSAVYVFDQGQELAASLAISSMAKEFDEPIITQVLFHERFVLNQKDLLNYYHSDTERPFCKNYISPKLKALMQRYTTAFDPEKLAHLND